MDKQNKPGIAHDEFGIPSSEAFIQAIPHVFRPPVELINKVNTLKIEGWRVPDFYHGFIQKNQLLI